MIMFIGWIVFIVVAEYLSVGVAVLAKREGQKNWWTCLLPFVAFFWIDKYTKGFKAMGVHVSKWGKTVITLVLICVLACVYVNFGQRNFASIDAEALAQIMAVPIVACAFIFYVGSIGWAIAVLQKNGRRFNHDTFVCMLFLPIPFLIAKSKV